MTRRWPRWCRPTWVEPMVAAFVVMVPAIVALIAVARPRWYPAGDMAQAELHVRGFWGHPPLVGAAGRIVGDTGVQGSHPGPALWVAMYPVYALLGRSSFALLTSVVSVHLAATTLTLWLARRRGGRSFMLAVAVVLLVLVRASGAPFLFEPWNPWLAVLPFAAFVLACWDVVEGHPRTLWLAVLTGSFAIQCHAGYALVVGGVLAVATGWSIVTGWRADRRSLRVGLGTAVGSGVAVWLPPLVDQWRRTPGNLTLLVQHFGSPDEPYLTWSMTRHVSALQFNALGPWVTGPTDERVSVPGLLAFVVVWAVAVAAAWRGRDRPALRLHALLGAGVVLGIVSVKRVFGGYFEYTTRWSWVLSALVVAASGWTLWRAWCRRTREPGALPRRSPFTSSAWKGAAVVVGVVAVTLVSVQVGARAEQPGPRDSRLLAGLAPTVVERLDRSPRYLLRFRDPTALGATGFGLLLDLERHGFHVGVDAPFSAGVLPHRVTYEDRVDAVLYLVVGRRIDAVRAQAGVDEVAYFDPRTPAQVTRTAELEAILARYLDDPEVPVLGGPTLPPEAQAALLELSRIRQPAAVFVVAPGTVIDALAET